MNSIDNKIKSEVIRRLKNTQQMIKSGIIVQIKNRTVILNGIVPTYRDRLLAYNKVKDIHGVLAVKNKLNIASNVQTQLPDDQDLKQICELIFEWIAEFDASKVELIVKGGIISLRGAVRDYKQKMLVEDILSSLKGVLDINNELAVIPSAKIKDELIAENIVSEYRSDSLLNASEIDVIVNKGQVILRGKVPSYKAVTQAYEIAIYNNGVTSVNNNLKVMD